MATGGYRRRRNRAEQRQLTQFQKAPKREAWRKFRPLSRENRPDKIPDPGSRTPELCPRFGRESKKIGRLHF